MRYVYADALIKKVFPYDVVDKKCYTINAKTIYEAIQEAPAADVAPKSEVAREIFEEIESIISPMLGLEDDKEYVAILTTTFAELKKKYIGE